MMNEWMLEGEFSPGSRCRIDGVDHEIVGIRHIKTKQETGDPAAWINLGYHQWQLKSDDGDKIVISTRVLTEFSLTVVEESPDPRRISPKLNLSFTPRTWEELERLVAAEAASNEIKT